MNVGFVKIFSWYLIIFAGLCLSENGVLAENAGSAASVSISSGLPGLTDDGLSHPPPATGAYAYNSFVPANTAGASYADPVFGSTVRRITTDHNPDDSYARNMWWNAAGTRYLHRRADFWDVIDAATGNITHHAIPIGSYAYDGGFDPVDPNVLYKYSGSTIRKVTLNADGTWTDAVYFTAPAAIKPLGGTLNWFDASGRYMLVRYGGEPSVRLYDRQNMAAGPYSNLINASAYINQGHYIGLSPDGQYLVGYMGSGGYAGSGEGVSWKIDHINRSVPKTPNRFWSLCGDHGSFISASDGRNYMIAGNCYSHPEIWRVDITNNAAGLNEDQQRALPNNMRLMLWPTWDNDLHYSTVAKGPLQDWAFVSTEDYSEAFNEGTADANGFITPWRAYRQEIIAFNAMTGEVRRLAHHRSRSLSSDYYYTPRLSVSWGGEYVAWNSNFNQNGIIDVYVLAFGAAIVPIDGDINADGTVNYIDLGLFTGRWLTAGADADFNHSGLVDEVDFALLAGNWLQQNSGLSLRDCTRIL